MTRRKICDARDARSCLDAAAGSGLTRAAWAHANGVDARSLQAWRLALERRDARANEELLPERLRLVEFVAAEPVSEAPVKYVVRCGAMAVEIDDRFDDDVLRRVLAVVASC